MPLNGSGTVTAVSAHKNELLLFFTLLELTLIVTAGRIGAAVASRVGQSAAVGEIIIGILLGPSLFGWVAPHAFNLVFHSAPPEPLLILSQLGLVLLMFQIGLEFDFAHLTERTNRAAVARISMACLALPFAGGFITGYWLPDTLAPQPARLDTALFVATAFSITALPILGRIMIDFNLTRTRLGVIAISSAAVNDVVGWLLLALITTLTVSNFAAGELRDRKKRKAGVVMTVLVIAMMTNMVNIFWEMTPRSNPTLTTMSSISARVFIMNPIMAACG
jgi:Kef-type K+ transport system membrane component KefB